MLCFSFSQFQDQDDVENVQCKTCKVNTYQADDRSEWVNHDSEDDCISCPKDDDGNLGMFAAQTDSMVVQGCSACPAGKQAETASCEDCVAGSFSNSVLTVLPSGLVGISSRCQKCPVGTTQKLSGTTSCMACIPGQYQSEEAQPECNHCPSGWMNIDKSSSDCIQ